MGGGGWRMGGGGDKGEGDGGGGSSGNRKKRKARLLAARRCEAARMRRSDYCVFHDPEMAVRRLRLKEEIPFEHPDDVQRLLAEAIEGVKKKRLSPRAGDTLGYLAALLGPDQPRGEGG